MVLRHVDAGANAATHAHADLYAHAHAHLDADTYAHFHDDLHAYDHAHPDAEPYPNSDRDGDGDLYRIATGPGAAARKHPDSGADRDIDRDTDSLGGLCHCAAAAEYAVPIGNQYGHTWVDGNGDAEFHGLADSECHGWSKRNPNPHANDASH